MGMKDYIEGMNLLVMENKVPEGIKKIKESIRKFGKDGHGGKMAWLANQNLGMHYYQNKDFYNAIKHFESTFSLPEPELDLIDKSTYTSSESPGDRLMSILVESYTKIIILNVVNNDFNKVNSICEDINNSKKIDELRIVQYLEVNRKYIKEYALINYDKAIQILKGKSDSSWDGIV